MRCDEHKKPYNWYVSFYIKNLNLMRPYEYSENKMAQTLFAIKNLGSLYVACNSKTEKLVTH